MANHIVPMIVDRIVEELQLVCIENIPFSDPTRVNKVKAERFQEDPTGNNLRISVMGGDLDDPDTKDGIVTLKEGSNSRVGFTIEPREIGGTTMWYRRGIVYCEFFFIVDQVPEMEARERAYTILGRIQQHIELIRVSDLTDDFGEHAIKLFHTQNSFFRSGGPPASYLYRGNLIWECLTERDWN